MNRKAMFLSNPKNAHFKNNGNSNININGNNNQVADTINNAISGIDGIEKLPRLE